MSHLQQTKIENSMELYAHAMNTHCASTNKYRVHLFFRLSFLEYVYSEHYYTWLGGWSQFGKFYFWEFCKDRPRRNRLH